MPERLAFRAFVPWVAALLASCGEAPMTSSRCSASSECAPGERCVDGRCMLGPDAGPDAVPSRDGSADGSTPSRDGAADVSSPAVPDAGCGCAAGQVCEASRCVDDCGHPEAEPCGEGRTCDFATGRCADAGATGILTGAGQTCAATGARCLPGTECALDGACVPAPPCASMRCTDDRATCWGRSCVATRPPGACAPAPLERMNRPDFIGGGDGGAFDLEFDDACHAYVVTMISGPDYLRQLAPDGTLTTWTGVTNLNMGEVAALRRPGNEFGDVALGEVALTYICCASCGCISADPQGVARLDRAGPPSLPMVIVAMPSSGDGPFGNRVLDAGPYGLTWGRDRRLYVGNVAAPGDLVRADLETGDVDEIHRLPARVHASATFDSRSLLVAVDGGAIHRVATDGPERVLFAEVGDDVTSLVRDPFTGHVFVSLRSARILELDREGAVVGELSPAPRAAGRLAYAPDGALYYLVPGWPGPAQVVRYDLPDALP